MSVGRASGGKLRHLLFDLDGTLVRSESLHERAFRRALQAKAPDLLARFRYDEHRGRPTADVFQQVGLTDSALVQDLTRSKQRFYREALDEGKLELVRGARELLDWTATMGYDRYLVTSGSRSSVAAALTASALEHSFHGIITGSDVSRGKPDAEPYAACLERFALNASDCAAIEDSIAGVLSARAAGIRAIGVHNPSLEGGADYFCASLIDVIRLLEKETR